MAKDLKADHPIRFHGSVPFSVNDDGRSVAEIKNFIQFLDPATIQRAAASYLAAADRLTAMNEALVSGASAMAKVWEGQSSVEAQQSLRTLHATIRELAAKFRAVGLPLETLGKRLLEHKEFVEGTSAAWSDNSMTFDDSVPGWYETINAGVEWGSQDELAGQHLRVLNDDLLRVYEEWPYNVHKVVPDLKSPMRGLPDTRTGDGSGGAGPLSGGDFQGPGIGGIGDTPGSGTSGVPGGDLDGSYPGGTSPGGTNPGGLGADGTNPDGTNPDGTYPGGVNPGTGSLTDRNPGGVNPNANPNPNPTPTNGTPDTRGVDTPDPRTTLAEFPRGGDPSSLPNSGSPYSTPSNGPGTGPGTGTGMGSGGNGMAGAGGLPINAKPASATGTGMPFMPMTGGGAGGAEEQDRENSTWLHQDDDVWGGDTDDAVSGKIG